MAHRIQYRHFGEGELVILVHGYGGSVHQWTNIKDILQHQFQVVIPNLSHIYMSHDKLLFSVQVAKFAMSLKEQFPGRRVHMVGTSYGAAICWALSILHPELVQSMTLVNPMVPNPIQYFVPSELRYFFVLPISKKAIFILLKTSIGKAFLRKTSELFKGEQKELGIDLDQLNQRKLMFIAHLMAQFSWILRNEDWLYWESKLADIYPQVTMVYDEDDTLFSSQTYENFSKMIEPFQKVITQKGGHASIIECAPVISNAIKTAVLSSMPGSKSRTSESA